MANTVSKRENYRPEIQGIRVIGALLVACFHIWGGRVSGGVDVFFVISGFLITGSLYRELQKTQAIDVVAFWGRIAKRIAPMAYLVLALTLAAAALWMPQTRQEGFLSEVLYSAVHLENLKLMMNAVDYLAREEAPSPVQQFWALSVQVQFYAVWPFLLLAAAYAAGKLRAGISLYLAVLAAVFLVSFTYSVLATSLEPAPTYFNTLARVWEFAIGGLLALILPNLALPAPVRWLAGWTGLALVVSCGFVVPASTSFPGYIALWPTLGAALVLLSGGGGLRLGVDRLLASRPLVAMGDISFSFYLWHWPVLIFAMLVSGQTHLGLGAGLAVIAIALCGAYLANRFLEQPILNSPLGKTRRWHVHAMMTAFAVPVVIVAGLWSIALDRTDSGKGPNLSLADYPGGTIPASPATALKPGVPLLPTPAAAKRDHARVYRDKCHQKLREAAVIECIYGNRVNPTKTLALVGGSHSAHWLPAIEALAEQYGWRIVSITKSSCLFEANDGRHSSCVQWNESVLQHLTNLKPDVVFTTSTRPDPSRASGRSEFVPSGFMTQWSRLAEKGLTVIAVRDNPRFSFEIPECIEKNSTHILDCSRRRTRLMDETDPTSALNPKPSNVEFIDLTDRFCDQSLCFPVSGNVVIYSDKHHLTATFSRTLAPVLGERMKRVRPDLFAHASGS